MNRLKKLRIEAEESQEYVGSIIGVSGQAVGQYELEKRDLSPDKILKLAEHYNCSTDYLLGKSDIRNPEQSDEDLLGLAKIGFSMKDYNPPTDKQREQLAELIKIVLKDNKKEKSDN